MPGPYFKGQQPGKCGHYYPDVLRLRDEKRAEGTFVRIMDCRFCGRYAVPLDLGSLVPALGQHLLSVGVIEGTPEEELAAVREKEMARLRLPRKVPKRRKQKGRL